VSGGRAANTFFLTINTALVAMPGIVWPHTGGLVSKAWYAIVGISGLMLCYTWYRILRSYRDLNSCKFRVVPAIEKSLPIRPYDAEWTSIGRGDDPKLYLPFTDIETKIPWVFFVLYISLIAIAILGLSGDVKVR
jgi:hypothetical protein